MDPKKGSAARLLIQTFLQTCVFPTQLKLDPAQLTSTPQDIPRLMPKSDAMGGTFGFETTWNPRLKRVPDHSVDEVILKALKEERNQTCHMLSKGGAEAFFSELGKATFDDYMALVDTGAIFKGISNTNVAERLIHSLHGFDCVLFWDEEVEGGAVLSVMTKDGKKHLEQTDREGVRRALSQMNLNKPFAYFDQDRRIGYDLEMPKGKGLLTFSNIALLDDVLQSAMRFRLLLHGLHSVAYVIPGEMEGEWNGNRVLDVAEEQQKFVEKKANFHGICEQLRGEFRSKIDRAMRLVKSEEKRHKIYCKSQFFLNEKQENDLVKSFGSLQKKMTPQEALKRIKEQLFSDIDRVITVRRRRKKAKDALEAILKFHELQRTPLPDEVCDGEELDDAVQEVEISKENDRLRLMEEEFERMLGSKNPLDEIKWVNFDLKKICPLHFGAALAQEDMPPIYKLCDAVKDRGFSVPFSDNLWISANLLATYLGETNCLLTENQKPVHRLLVFREEEGTKFVLVSEGDAFYLKNHLLQKKISNVFLVEPSGAINQRGDQGENIVNLWRDGTLEERSLLLQTLIFQGSALVMNKLPDAEVKDALNYWSERKTEIRILFETALNLHPEDMRLFRGSQKLRGLF
jgi:hypothetical protein